MQGTNGSPLGRFWRVLALRSAACRYRADLRRLSPHQLRDIGVEPHALEAFALALAAREVGRERPGRRREPAVLHRRKDRGELAVRWSHAEPRRARR